MAELILFNADVFTMDPATPKAQLVAVQNGKICAVTKNERLKELKNQKTITIDCNGKALLPGFIDSHLHLHAFAESLTTLNLGPRNTVRSISDILEKIRCVSQKLLPGTWIRGGGYDEFHLKEKRHPTRWDLDKATPNHPVKLTHRSGHAHVLNSSALKLSGISRKIPCPEGSLIDLNIETGEPTGLLYGMSAWLSKSIPPLDDEQLREGIMLANKELLAVGITSFQDASHKNDIKRWKMFKAWKKQGLLKSRISMMIGAENFDRHKSQDFSAEMDKNQLCLGGVKITLNETTGRLNPSRQELNEMVLDVHRSGSQAIIHAIEEPSIEAACNAIEYALQRFPRGDHRHRIEHCSVCPPALAKRLASLGVMVVTQPPFIYYHGERYLKTVPRRQLEHLYPLATLIKNGVTVSGSSDCPVVPPNPLIGIYAAVSHTAETGEIVLSKERIAPLEALKMYTKHAAKTNFEEKIKGSIAPGKLADLVVLSGDPTRLSASELKDCKVEMTILDGEVVWDKTA